MPATLSIINDLFRDPRERSRAIGLWAGTSGIGIAIGPIAGGLLLAHFWWGSVFFVNVPIVVVGLVGASCSYRTRRTRTPSGPTRPAALLSMLGLGCVLWAIIEAPTHGWSSTKVVAVGVAGLAVLGVFVAWEARSDHPMLNLAFFRARRFSAATSSLSLGVFALFGALFVQTQFLQFDLHLSALGAGVRILPIAAVVALTAPLSVLVVRFAGSKVTARAGLLAIAGGLARAAAGRRPRHDLPAGSPGMILIGLGAGLLMPTATDAVIGSLPPGDAGVGSATNGVAIQVGGALGVAVVGSVLSTRYQHHLAAAAGAGRLPPAVLHAALGSIGGALDVAAKLPAGCGASARPGRRCGLHERHRDLAHRRGRRRGRGSPRRARRAPVPAAGRLGQFDAGARRGAAHGRCRSRKARVDRRRRAAGRRGRAGSRSSSKPAPRGGLSSAGRAASATWSRCSVQSRQRRTTSRSGADAELGERSAVRVVSA